MNGLGKWETGRKCQQIPRTFLPSSNESSFVWMNRPGDMGKKARKWTLLESSPYYSLATKRHGCESGGKWYFDGKWGFKYVCETVVVLVALIFTIIPCSLDNSTRKPRHTWQLACMQIPSCWNCLTLILSFYKSSHCTIYTLNQSMIFCNYLFITEWKPTWVWEARGEE